ncbi:MAG: S1-like domain-containing RNA-binding protein [Firmicutes bacterium]|nr:S1-like domain-containing RNA-binding protein [Bacillota bacterium]MDD6694867.1 S1-like domain-containing RNA-binding protein [Bacillota bacterium]MDY3770108.1 S1-like domain-containing RNA-binding protein [Lachnospiraceae bacterium]
MIFGKKQTLVMIKRVEFGIYLAETMKDTENKVLLPKKQVPADMEVGDPIDVFLYKDSNDRPIATVKEPKLTLGQTARLRVVSVGKVGAFLDWGLEKDLFLPYREQTTQVKAGDEVIAALYLDKSERLCATMKVYPYLQKESPYQKDDVVTGMVYEISHNFGAFVAVDDKYSALIPKKELYGELHVLQQISARVTGVKEDGKLDLGIRQKAHLQMSEDADKVLALLREKKGFLPLHDKSSPEQIRETVGMSKNEFKRAIGRLYKEHLITLESDGIRLKK